MTKIEKIIEALDKKEADENLYKLVSIMPDRNKAITKLSEITSCITYCEQPFGGRDDVTILGINKIHSLSYSTLSQWFEQQSTYNIDDPHAALFFSGTQADILNALNGTFNELCIAASRIAIDPVFDTNDISKIRESFFARSQETKMLNELRPYLAIGYWKPSKDFLDFLLSIFEEYRDESVYMLGFGGFVDSLIASLAKHKDYDNLASVAIDARWYWGRTLTIGQKFVERVVGSVCRKLGDTWISTTTLCKSENLMNELRKRLQSEDSREFESAIFYCLSVSGLAGFELDSNWNPLQEKFKNIENEALLVKAMFAELTEDEFNGIKRLPKKITHALLLNSAKKNYRSFERVLHYLAESEDWFIDACILGIVLVTPGEISLNAFVSVKSFTSVLRRYKRHLMFICGNITDEQGANILFRLQGVIRDGLPLPEKNVSLELRKRAARALYEIDWDEIQPLLDEALQNPDSVPTPSWVELDIQKRTFITMGMSPELGGSEKFDNVEKLHASSALIVLHTGKQQELAQSYFVEHIKEILILLEKGELGFSEMFSELVERSREILPDEILATVINEVSRIRNDISLSQAANNEAANLLQRLARLSVHRYIPD